jgi:uncharacterized protein (UPF0264 family)
MKSAVVRWSGLLVSVRDAAEATEAVAGGAAIIDVKEPTRGPLGAAAPAAAAAVAAAVPGRLPWTLACGELAVGADVAAAHAAAAIAAAPAGASRPAAAKAGSAGLTPAAWRRAFAAFAQALPVDVEPIAVAYADWHSAAAPAPDEVAGAAAALGGHTLLIDTFDKNAPGVLALGAAAELAGWIAAAHAAGLAVAVAGRLTLADIGTVAGMGADVVAVRAAACQGGRLGRVDRALVAAAATGLAASRVAS